MSATGRDEPVPTGSDARTVAAHTAHAALGGLVRAARRARIDRLTAEVVTVFRSQGIRPVLLKGPAVARWLYPSDPQVRFYGDVDIMVSPAQMAEAEAALHALGFTPGVHPLGSENSHATAWHRAAGEAVDLHRTLHNAVRLSRQAMWEAVSTGTETIDVGGVAVEIPGVALRVMHVVLHLRLGDDARSQASRDCLRAIEVVPRSEWREATDLATRLGLDDVMGAKLRLLGPGASLADELGLPVALPQVVELEVASVGIRTLVHLTWARGWRAKAGWTVRVVFPSPHVMRNGLRFRTLARSGPLGLGLAYVLRLASMAVELPRAVVGWRRISRRR